MKNYQANSLAKTFTELVEIVKNLESNGPVEVHIEPNSCGSGEGVRVFWNKLNAE